MGGLNYESLCFVHIPKTGGTSIKKVLEQNNLITFPYLDELGHDRLSSLIMNYGHLRSFESAFLFSVVRNPFTRTYSYYHHFCKHNEITLTFLEFLDYIRSSRFFPKTPFVKFPQTFFITTVLDRPIYLYKLEEIEVLEKVLGLSFPKYNQGNYNVEMFYEDYTEEAQDIVRERFRIDFDKLNYSLEFRF